MEMVKDRLEAGGQSSTDDDIQVSLVADLQETQKREAQRLLDDIETKVCFSFTFEPVHEIFNNVVCATSKASDQPAHMRSLIRAFASRLSIL